MQKLLKNFHKNHSRCQNLFAAFEKKESLDDYLCIKLTGLTKEEIIDLESYISISMGDSENRTKVQALAIYLFWLRTGLQQHIIAIFFNLDNRFVVQKICAQVRAALTEHFVCKYLGTANKERSFFTNNNTELAKILFELNDDQLITICDGTYLYCEKSLNNLIQRLTYSCQKKRPLIKPFLIVCANGYIIDCYGPFSAASNDASILDSILNHVKNNDLKNIIKPGDLMVLDRGFRDIVEDLKKDYNLKPYMPTCSKEQLTTAQANQTRFITKIRWTIEAINGTIKQFRALEKTRNSMLPHIMQDFRIAAAIVNRYYSKKLSDIGNETEIANLMKQRFHTKNNLANYINKHVNLKNNNFEEIEQSQLNDFPKLDLEIIKNKITLGSYQLKMSQSYLAEHFASSGDRKLFIDKDFESENEFKRIIVKIQSRHSNNMKHKLVIQYKPDDIDESNISWACSCFSGLRTVGCCVHIATVIYYYSHGKYLAKLTLPGRFLNNLFQMDQEGLKNTQEVACTSQHSHFNSLKSDNSQKDINKLAKHFRKTLSQLQSSQVRSDFQSESEDLRLIDSLIIAKKETKTYSRSLKKTCKKNASSSHNELNSVKFRDVSKLKPSWGGKISTQREEFIQYDEAEIENTCPIDYFLFTIWHSSKLSNKFLHLILKQIYLK